MDRQDGIMIDRAMVSQWVADYESAWRTPATEGLAELFSEDATYLQSPYETPIVGIDAIRRMWDEERDSYDEIFSLASEIVAVEGDTAVVRAEVHYGNPVGQYRDLWVLRLDGTGRCSQFEEWPFWPGRAYKAPAVTPAG
jgi:ketosteroid isomerase-like protein